MSPAPHLAGPPVIAHSLWKYHTLVEYFAEDYRKNFLKELFQTNGKEKKVDFKGHRTLAEFSSSLLGFV